MDKELISFITFRNMWNESSPTSNDVSFELWYGPASSTMLTMTSRWQIVPLVCQGLERTDLSGYLCLQWKKPNYARASWLDFLMILTTVCVCNLRWTNEITLEAKQR
ncbi:unnamed protein product [Absidia cylindrospora]